MTIQWLNLVIICRYMLWSSSTAEGEVQFGIPRYAERTDLVSTVSHQSGKLMYKSTWHTHTSYPSRHWQTSLWHFMYHLVFRHCTHRHRYDGPLTLLPSLWRVSQSEELVHTEVRKSSRHFLPSRTTYIGIVLVAMFYYCYLYILPRIFSLTYRDVAIFTLPWCFCTRAGSGI